MRPRPMKVKQLRGEAQDLKEVVAKQALEFAAAQKKHDRGWGRPNMRLAASKKSSSSSTSSNSRICRSDERWSQAVDVLSLV